MTAGVKEAQQLVRTVTACFVLAFTKEAEAGGSTEAE